MVVLLACGLCLALPVGASASWPGQPGPVVYRGLVQGFEAEGQEEQGLWRINPFTHESRIQLTPDPSDQDPRLSPDGRLIAFSRGIKPNERGFPTTTAIFVMRLDGGGLRRVTDPPSGYADIEPAFTRSGRRLVFARVRRVAEYGGDIYAVRIDGRRLLRLTSGPAEDNSPAFSPNGRQIVFERAAPFRNGKQTSVQHIYSMRPNGRRLRDLTPSLKGEWPARDPDFGRRGRRIVFSIGSHLRSKLWIMRANGKRPWQVSDRPGYGEPVFAPNSRQVIATELGGSGPYDLVRFHMRGKLTPDYPGGVTRWGDMAAWAPR